MNDGFSRPYVRTVFLSLVFLVSIASPAVASQGGVNEEASIEDTGVESVSHPDSASAGEIFEVSVRLNEESASNATSVTWVTQVCVNSGICYPPETHSMTDENDAWEGSIVPEETVTYVNWKIEIEWDDGNTTSGWRGWSDCWYDNGTWGGASTECQSDDSSFTPGFATPLAIASMSLATLMIRRE